MCVVVRPDLASLRAVLSQDRDRYEVPVGAAAAAAHGIRQLIRYHRLVG